MVEIEMNKEEEFIWTTTRTDLLVHDFMEAVANLILLGLRL